MESVERLHQMHMKRTMTALLVVFLISTILCGCMIRPCTVRVHQEFENVVKIELLDTSDEPDIKVLYTLDETEHESFWKDLHAITFVQYPYSPPTSYGPLSVRIFYRDGHIDFLGYHINAYYTANGENVARDGWYGVKELKEFEALFAKYLKESTPESDC